MCTSDHKALDFSDLEDPTWGDQLPEPPMPAAVVHDLGGSRKMVEDAKTSEAQFKAQSEALFKHRCGKCGGSGVYHWGYMNPRSGKCHACNGRGGFKTSIEDRVKARASAANRKARKGEENLQLFAENEPSAYEWLTTAKGNFARSLLDSIRKYGSLTEKQLAAVYRIIAENADRAQKQEASASQTQIDMSDLLHRFELATRAGIKRPKVNTGDLLFSLAPANGKNAGYVYVKGPKDDWDDRPYLGKISPEGRFYPSRDADTAVQSRVAEIGADVVKAAKAHGAQHGNCCFCSRDLTTNESVSNGYGPVCAERYGLPWEVTPEFKAAKEALKAAQS